ncbi:dienelactone hydrolase family protein [Homoserinimonas sp. OAct 916]|uniref:dienelactone hydrolase family protein n=1 Tax=Homoserinimonas sp. OAct 916 TaxID=2211450 RepID=UPI000DBE56A1|nr:dienelactone hydrolase family protein [Homoserinimonas sp. OAct 916]
MSRMLEIGVDHETASVSAYRSDPPSGTPVAGGLIVVHEIWGLVDHTKRVADRFADEGYRVLAPNLMPDGAPDEGEITQLQDAMFDADERVRTAIQPRLRELFTPANAPDFAAQALGRLGTAFDFLLEQPGVCGRVAIVGFCFGGTQAFSLAVNEPRLVAAVPFYGHADYSEDQLRAIRCPILAFYGDQDSRLMEALPGLTRSMTAAAVDFRPQVYADCGHAFFNDTSRFAYRADAAASAWRMTLDFLADLMSIHPEVAGEPGG